MVTPAHAPYTFDLSGGRLCLDFANTVSDRGGDGPVDHLRSYDDLLAFAEQTRALRPAVLRELRRSARDRAADARSALAAARDLREALFRLFAATAGGRPVKPGDLAIVNELLPWIFRRSRLAGAGGRFVLMTEADGAGLHAPLVPIVRSAVDLLTSPDAARLRSCAADTCEWLFIDTTKNRARRWCDMKVCGNRAKVRRFRERSA